jgi:hypothetical protein
VPGEEDVVSPFLAGGGPLLPYYIAGGVRRSVAAREVGYLEIAARIVEPGKPDMVTRIALEQLYSPKAIILRDLRYLKVEIATRAKMIVVPIEVQPLGLSGQLPTIKLSQVQLR